jgi:hypothetical protein
VTRCDKAPEGWKCTREGGHDGPCAAVQVADARQAQGTPSEWGPRCGVPLPGAGSLPYACVYEAGHPGSHWLGVSW